MTDEPQPYGSEKCKALFKEYGSIFEEENPSQNSFRVYIKDEKSKKKQCCPLPGKISKNGWCEIIEKVISINQAFFLLHFTVSLAGGYQS